VVVLGAVLLPSTVWAVDTFSNVAIEDPVSGVKAHVAANNRLLVGDGSGSLTVDGNVKAADQTAVLTDDSIANSASEQFTPTAIVNPYKEVRVGAALVGVCSSSVTVEVLAGIAGFLPPIDRFTLSCSAISVTRTYDIPGQFLEVGVTGGSSSNTHVVVLGRAN
jgi:hypothetical protein